jgi:squalene-hopene/tetraprenyl-beta-curcumene cyclase
MSSSLAAERIKKCYDSVKTTLLSDRNARGYWEGELSTSALSTATAVMALEMVRRDRKTRDSTVDSSQLQSLTEGGLKWLAGHQNDDGGWGDTTKSLSNISTSMLGNAVFHATGQTDRYRSTVEAAKSYIDRTGGVKAVIQRYGKDKTFSTPILTHCALAGLVDWKDVSSLPFELACLPHRFYKTVRLPVVSYALPALIAIGQVRFHHRKPWNPLLRLLRKSAIRRSLNVLESIQPPHGGFLEAAPLTSFVTMSLAGMGLSEHPVVEKGVQFLIDSVKPDGSWLIDTNLATWVTTLSVNALGEDLPEDDRPAIRDWLLGQQYQDVHPYTNADPGGWAWTDLPGGVPDADDTPGAVLAILNLRRSVNIPAQELQACENGVIWLLDVQNRNGGWPTFCRGWGALPFDRSAPDISAHVIRALSTWLNHPAGRNANDSLRNRAQHAVDFGFEYLSKSQRDDGSWLPLWFGNQYNHLDENPTYGTARVLAAYRDTGRIGVESAQRGLEALRVSQNSDGGWGGTPEVDSSVEETALATEIMVSIEPDCSPAQRGVQWLLNRVENGSVAETTPIGFYFAKLWYCERLYPLIFTTSALRAACRFSEVLAGGNDLSPGATLQQQTVSNRLKVH